MSDTVRDIALDINGDLAISSGDLQLVSGSDAIVQAVKIRLQFFKGEWFLNLDAGVPYFQEILVKNPNPNVLQTLFRKALLETPGVLAIESLALTFDGRTRQLAVSYRVTTDVGELASTEVL